MKADVLGPNGSAQGSIELSDAVFKAPVSAGAIYYKLRNERANARQGTVKTKERGEVKYSGRKPWRQKGTGRARAGDRRSPIWVGGGAIFGPQPRDYSYTMPKKIRKTAFRSLFSQKVEEKLLVVINLVASQNGKTGALAKELRMFVPEELHNVVLIIDENNAMIKRAARNIPWLKVLVYSQLALKELVYAQRVLITQEAIRKLNEFYGQASHASDEKSQDAGVSE